VDLEAPPVAGSDESRRRPPRLGRRPLSLMANAARIPIDREPSTRMPGSRHLPPHRPPPGALNRTARVAGLASGLGGFGRVLLSVRATAAGTFSGARDAPPAESPSQPEHGSAQLSVPGTTERPSRHGRRTMQAVSKRPGSSARPGSRSPLHLRSRLDGRAPRMPDGRGGCATPT
jgi:hypothetical protein